MKINFSKYGRESGFALLLSIIIASVVLAIGVAILKISVSQLQLSATGRESEVSFQASQSMAECLIFWTDKNRENFIARPGTPGAGTPGYRLNAPNINCMGENNVPVESYAEIVENVENYHIVKFHYMFDWAGDAGLCSSADVYVMAALKADIPSTKLDDAPAAGVNGDGWKSCNQGSVCTVLVTQGYNRPCDQLRSSIFTVQRELTTQF